MPVFILGGIRFGVVTPTEAAVVAAVYALIIGMFVYRELKPRELYDVFLVSAKSTASIMFLVAAALVSAWLITGANIPGEISGFLQPLIERPKLLMAAMMVLVIVVGTALDFAPTVLILTPILMPIVRQAGIDPVYFGVLFIMNNAIGLLTPPVGIVLNVVSGVARVPMWEVMKGVLPFILTLSGLMFLMVLFPEIVTVPARFLLGR
jgi:tripartite ATP-independent transporter DctM subunit